MATLTEKIDSREWTTGEKPTVTMHYTLDGTPDDLTAKMLLLNSTPTEYDGLVRDECTLEPIFVDTTTGQGKWECTVRYVAPENTQPPVGEVLFLGASGSKRGSDDWEITFRFAASPNKTGLTVGDIVNINKKGWEYMWVRYADAEDAVAKAIVKKPVAVYVEKVYEDGDFSGLGIGT